MAEDIDDDDDDARLDSGCTCASCKEDIKLTDEVFLVSIVLPIMSNGVLTCFDVIDERNTYKYPPIFFCFECWESELEDVRTVQEDVPPMVAHDGVIRCDVCNSDVCSGESVGLIQFGEIRLTGRRPNNTLSASFQVLAEPEHFCIACLTHLEDNQREPFWHGEIEPVPDLEVCVEGIFERCWRGGNCICPKRICESNREEEAHG